jgi:SpoVK/Ycf46/Vps4 family AAA+-type ATPase
LIEFFFEDRYNNNNKKHSIGFSNKIIVIEDIDAQGDIVLERKNKTQTNNNALNSIIKTIIDSNSDVENAIPTVANDSSTVVSDVKASSAFLKQPDDDLITLDDILGIWDGIKETDGRILVISSNHYEKLDPALTRPGRIDIPLEMKNASKNVIRDMYAHLYSETIDENDLKKIRDKYHSPASLINIFTTYKNEPDLFIKTLYKIQRDTPIIKTNKKVVMRDSKTSNTAKKNNELVNDNELNDEIISNELVNEL